jgi:hypothetical protein
VIIVATDEGIELLVMNRWEVVIIAKWMWIGWQDVAEKVVRIMKGKSGNKLVFGESHENWSLVREIITVRHFKNPG